MHTWFPSIYVHCFFPFQQLTINNISFLFAFYELYKNIYQHSTSITFFYVFFCLTSIKMHNCQFRYQTYLFYNRNDSGFKKYLCTSGGSAREMKCNVTSCEVQRDGVFGFVVRSTFVLNKFCFVRPQERHQK